LVFKKIHANNVLCANRWVSQHGHIYNGPVGLVDRELLRGPLYYVMVLVLCTVLFWRDSPVSVVSLAMMCAGDGIADIVGRRFGSKKLPYNSEKSWAGSITMFLFGFVVSLGYVPQPVLTQFS
jgi:dolichol kinase